MGLDRRGYVAQPRLGANRRREEPWDEVRPFDAVCRRLSIGSRMKREFHVRF